MKLDYLEMAHLVADEGKVFDWAEPRYIEIPINPEKPEEGMKQEQEHLYVKEVWMGPNDSVGNYIEVDTPEVEG